MIAYYFKNFFRGIALNLLFLFPISIVVGMCVASQLAALIGSTVACLILFIICFIFKFEAMISEWLFGVYIGNEFVSKRDIENNNKRRETDNSIFRAIIQGKRISFWGAYAWLFLHLILTIICIIMFIFIYRQLNIPFATKNFLLPLTLQTAFIQFVYFIVRLIHYIKATCFKCGSIFSKAEVEQTSDSHSSIIKKDRKSSEEVGSIYSDNTKIGSVYLESTTTDAYHCTSTRYNHKCKCIFCGKDYNKKTESFSYYKA